MNNEKLLESKCPGMLKLTGLFGWRHTYRVHHHQKGILQPEIHKTYSLNLPAKKHQEASTSRSSQSDASTMVKSVQDDLFYILFH